MAKITVDGTIQTPSKTGSFFVLWEKFMLNNGTETKRRWTVWQSVPIHWTPGTWVELEGEFGKSIQRNEDGSPITIADKNGHLITTDELSINNAVILREKIAAPMPEGLDPDDVRKQGGHYGHLTDGNPF